jgi:hypothetical protein
MKTVILDSSTIISLSLNSLLDILRALKKNFDVRFLITPYVKKEVVDNPLEMRRFELEALMISKLIDEKVLEIMSQPVLEAETKRFYELSNSVYSAQGENIRIVHYGEASCLALSSLIPDSVIAMDERTTRMLCENPSSFRKLMAEKLHTEVQLDKSNLKFFSGFRILRSSELAYVALEKNLISFPATEEQAVRAVLYALKHKGCAISREEIEEAESM